MDTVENILAAIDPSKPVLLVDADEVLLRFVERLEKHILNQGFELRLTSFRLAGNIYHHDSNTVASPEQVKSLISSFFEECVDDVAPVPDAAEGLIKLSEYYQITVLSNVPKKHRERRATNLAAHGIDYPVIANKGDKGPIVKLFNEVTNKHTVFVDDLPPQHSSVAEHCPNSHKVHFVADKRLAAMIGKAPHADVRIDCWRKLTSHLQDML